MKPIARQLPATAIWGLLALFMTGIPAIGGEIFFNPAASWRSQLGRHSSDIAVGDVDLDGDLDLVVANWAVVSLYLNEGGQLQATPRWEAAASENYGTYSVELGDVDGNGYPDLVCGNWRARNSMFFNLGGHFEEEPSWYASPEDQTEDLALGDVDNDGDLDLLVAGWSQNLLYQNVGGALDTTACWADSAVSGTTSAIALGDLNGDGLLDLVCANGQFICLRTSLLRDRARVQRPSGGCGLDGAGLRQAGNSGRFAI